MDKLDFYFPYSTLSNRFKDILLAHSYYDIINPGKDDRADDYFEIFYHGDSYLQSVIENGLSDVKREYKTHNYRTVIHAQYDPNSTARTPRIAYKLSSNLVQLRLWLLEITIKYYNEVDHLNYLTQSEEFKLNTQLFKSTELKFIQEYKPAHSWYTIDYEFRAGEFNSKNKINFIADKIDDSIISVIVKHIELERRTNSNTGKH